MKRKANRGKSTRINYKVGMDSVSYSSMRQKDWFEDEEREEGLSSFWCYKQKHIYDDIYQSKSKPVRPMQPIDMALLRSKAEFAEAVEVTGRMGLHHIMGIQCDYNVDLLKQFFGTLVIKGDEARTLKWMSGNVFCSATFHEFAALLGYEFKGISTPCGIRLHGP